VKYNFDGIQPLEIAKQLINLAGAGAAKNAGV